MNSIFAGGTIRNAETGWTARYDDQGQVAEICDEHGNPVPIEHVQIRASSPLMKEAPASGKTQIFFHSGEGKERRVQLGLKQPDRLGGVDLAAQIERLNINLELLLDRISVGCAQRVDRAGHDSSSPVVEGAATPTDATVVEGAAGSPSSLRDGLPQGGES